MRRKGTYNCANGVFLCGGRLLECLVDDQVQEEIIAAQYAADLATALKVDEQFLVHELMIDQFLKHAQNTAAITFFNSGWDALDMIAELCCV